jgi:hypothetical protein
MAASGLNIRKFEFQNPSSGKIYEVALYEGTTSAVTGRGVLLGTNRINSDPITGNTVITFVVVTASLADVFGVSAKTDEYMVAATIYNASNPGGAAALLGTILV